MKAKIMPATERIVPNYAYLLRMNTSSASVNVGDIVICKDTGTRYTWDGSEWVMYIEPTVNTLDTGLNLYDLNKQLIEKLPDYSEDDLVVAKSLIEEFVTDIHSEFYMLLNKDINYYTVFYVVDNIIEPKCVDEIIACIQELGIIKSISKTEDGQAIEIWIQQEDIVSVMYLFNYAGGVIQCCL